MTYCYPLQMNLALLSENIHVIEGKKKKKDIRFPRSDPLSFQLVKQCSNLTLINDVFQVKCT